MHTDLKLKVELTNWSIVFDLKQSQSNFVINYKTTTTVQHTEKKKKKKDRAEETVSSFMLMI